MFSGHRSGPTFIKIEKEEMARATSRKATPLAVKAATRSRGARQPSGHHARLQDLFTRELTSARGGGSTEPGLRAVRPKRWRRTAGGEGAVNPADVRTYAGAPADRIAPGAGRGPRTDANLPRGPSRRARRTKPRRADVARARK